MSITDHEPQAISRINVLTTNGTLNHENQMTELVLADGRTLRMLTTLLESSVVQEEKTVSTSADSTVIPLIEEQLQIGKRVVETGRIRLQKGVQEFETILNEPLAVRTYDIERVILNQPVEAAPSVRVEGETTIYPLVEEQLILTKQLILKEEVRVTRRESERKDTRSVMLRRENLVVERIPAE